MQVAGLHAQWCRLSMIGEPRDMRLSNISGDSDADGMRTTQRRWYQASALSLVSQDTASSHHPGCNIYSKFQFLICMRGAYKSTLCSQGLCEDLVRACLGWGSLCSSWCCLWRPKGRRPSCWSSWSSLCAWDRVGLNEHSMLVMNSLLEPNCLGPNHDSSIYCVIDLPLFKIEGVFPLCCYCMFIDAVSHS